MPKGKRGKGRRANNGDLKLANGSDTESVVSEVFETTSVASTASDNGNSLDGDLVDQNDVVNCEDLLKDAMEELLDGKKGAKARLNHLRSIRVGLSKRFMDGFVEARRDTFKMLVERCLKRGSGAEVHEAAIVAVLVIMQLGGGPDTEDIFAALEPTLSTILLDASASSAARVGCATALGMLTYLANDDPMKVEEVMAKLERVFSGSYAKGDGSQPTVKPDVCGIHREALLQWSLLLPTLSSAAASSLITSRVNRIADLLENSNVEMRIACGETIALIYELGRDLDEEGDFEARCHDNLLETLKELATDSAKYRAKKDRATQRANFRAVLQYVEEGKLASKQVKFGQEEFYLESWNRRVVHGCFRDILQSGFNAHLATNPLLRDVFDLGSVLPTNGVSAKPAKRDRATIRAFKFKLRTLQRGKHRDKRSIHFSSSDS